LLVLLFSPEDRQYIPPKCQVLFKLHGVTTHTVHGPCHEIFKSNIEFIWFESVMVTVFNEVF
jgi:uncharacterized Fe-S cluster-containing protein